MSDNEPTGLKMDRRGFLKKLAVGAALLSAPQLVNPGHAYAESPEKIDEYNVNSPDGLLQLLDSLHGESATSEVVINIKRGEYTFSGTRKIKQRSINKPDEYFETNAAIVLPAKKKLHIIAEPATKFLIPGSAHIGIYSNITGALEISGLEIQRTGVHEEQSESEIAHGMRSSILVDGDSTQKSKTEVRIEKCTINDTTDTETQLLSSGIYVNGVNEVSVDNTAVINPCWDGIAALNATRLTVSKSSIQRTKLERNGAGSAIAFLGPTPGGHLSVRDTTLGGFVKFIGSFRPKSSTALHNVTIDNRNDNHLSHYGGWLLNTVKGTAIISGLNMYGPGVNTIFYNAPEYAWIRGSTFHIDRQFYPNQHYNGVPVTGDSNLEHLYVSDSSIHFKGKGSDKEIKDARRCGFTVTTD